MIRVMENLQTRDDDAMVIRVVYEGQHRVFNAGIERPTPSGTSPKKIVFALRQKKHADR